MSTTIAVTNQKGGTGKTTTSSNLATGLALVGNRVLLIDIDPQANTTAGFGLHDPEVSVQQVMDGTCGVTSAVYETQVKGLYLIPSPGSELAHFEFMLVQKFARESILKNHLQAGKAEVDYILIDCPPNLGTLTVNALTAADLTLIPTNAERFSYDGVENLLKTTIREIQNSVNPNLAVLGILVTSFDKRLRGHRRVVTRFEENYPQYLLETMIRTNTQLANANEHDLPIQLFDANSCGAHDYRMLTEEVLQRCQANQPAHI